MILDAVSNFDTGSVMSALRLFRVARLFRLVRFLKGLNRLFNAFILSLPKLANVGSILFLLIFLFAVLGVDIFAKVRLLGAHNEQANFKSFWRAIITLLRCMTGEAWNDLMHSIRSDKFTFESVAGLPCSTRMDITAQNYDELLDLGYLQETYECGAGWTVMLYFVVYTVVVSIIMINLFVAVIFEGFEDSQKSEERAVLTLCSEVWRKYDPDLKLVIPLHDALAFISEVIFKHDGKRLFREKNNRDQATVDVGYASALRLRVASDDGVHFRSAIIAVLRYAVVLGGQSRDQSRRIAREMDSMEDAEFPHQEYVESKLGGLQKKHDAAVHASVGEVLSFEEKLAALKIQRRFKERVERRRMKDDRRHLRGRKRAAEEANIRWDALRAYAPE
jgi:hypothetical protein